MTQPINQIIAIEINRDLIESFRLDFDQVAYSPSLPIVTEAYNRLLTIAAIELNGTIVSWDLYFGDSFEWHYDMEPTINEIMQKILTSKTVNKSNQYFLRVVSSH